MKKKIGMLFLVLCMTMAAWGLSGCDRVDAPSGEDYVYDAEKVQANIDKLTESGYKITLRYLSTGNDSDNSTETQTGGFTIAADGDLWLCEQTENGSNSVVIMDFSGDTEFVTYTKNDGDEKWEKTVTSYEYFGGKETVKTLYTSTYLTTFTGYGMLAVGLKNKGPVTVAGRACTKYEASISTLGASYSNEYCIDNETGLCLKNVVAVGSVTEGSASASYECTVFEVGYRITLPADSECVTEDDPANGGGNGGEIGGGNGTTPDIDFDAIMGGAGSADVIYGQLDEDTKQAIIAEAKKDGVEVTFGADGSMTVVDPESGDTIVQKPDGTWAIKGENGEEGQLGGAWPDNEFTKLIPKPDFALLAASTTENDFSAGFEDATIEQIRDYVGKVQAKGFTLDAETTDEEAMGMVIYQYTAKNADGYTVTVIYTESVSSVTVEKP